MKINWIGIIGGLLFGFFMGYQFGWVGVVGCVGILLLFGKVI